MSVTVLVRIQTRPGMRAAFLEEFRRIMPLVHAEAGCLEYRPVIDMPTELSRQTLIGDDAVMIVERWESLPALQAHLDAPHMHAYRPRVADLIESSQLHILQDPPTATV